VSLCIPALKIVRTQARVKLSGQWRYCGRAGTPEAQAKYERLIGEWLANGRTLPDQAPKPVPQLAPYTLSTDDLVAAYLAYAEAWYRKSGRETSSVGRIRCSLALWLRFGMGPMAAADLGARDVKDFQLWLTDHPERRWARKSINQYVADIGRMYTWAASEQLLEDGPWRDIQRVRPLQRGRAPAAHIATPREGKRRQPVPVAIVEQTLAHASPVIAAMVRLQLTCAMRPGEVCALRPDCLRPSSTPGVTIYDVPAGTNKTEHHEIDRSVMLGPASMAILEPWLKATPSRSSPVFRPTDALAMLSEDRRAARRTPMYESHQPHIREARRREAGAQPRTLGDSYTTSTYARAIMRACDRAFPHPTITEPGSEAESTKLHEWQRAHRWSPNQLRHTAATRITEKASLEVARELLGHRSIQTTLIYAKVHEHRAAASAAALT
jgi:integrase